MQKYQSVFSALPCCRTEGQGDPIGHVRPYLKSYNDTCQEARVKIGDRILSCPGFLSLGTMPLRTYPDSGKNKDKETACPSITKRYEGSIIRLDSTRFLRIRAGVFYAAINK